MNSKLAYAPIILAASLIVAACGAGAESSPNAVGIASRRTVTGQWEVPGDHDGRHLGIDVNEAGNMNFDHAFEIARDAGIDFVSLTIYWDAFEITHGEYAPDVNWLEIANSYYSANDVDIALVIAPIDTNVLHTPDDLEGAPFDDPFMIARFQSFLDYVLGKLDSVELLAISIGNEIDVFLGSDQPAWDSYRTFYGESAKYIHALDPGYKVGVKSTFNGLVHDHVTELNGMNENSDLILTTYYPLGPDFLVRPPDAVFNDFDLLTLRAGSKPIYFLEIGYPSSTKLGSSEQAQAEFVDNAFKAWDMHAEQIGALNFTWLHDIPYSQVKDFADYYGITSGNFSAYLATLGLRRSDGVDKQAFIRLKAGAVARGW
jgi:hypothetical protein